FCSFCICVCVCLYVCVCVSVCACESLGFTLYGECMIAQVFACIFILAWILMHLDFFVSVHLCMFWSVCKCRCACVCVSVCACVCACVCVCLTLYCWLTVMRVKHFCM